MNELQIVCDARDEKFHFKFIHSMKNIGFSIIKNRNIFKELDNSNTFKQIKNDWLDFFKSENKLKYLNSDGQVGFFPFRSENSKDNFGKKGMEDLKEFYQSYLIERTLPELPHKTLLNDYFNGILEVSNELLDIISKDYGKRDFKKECFQSRTTIMRALYYPNRSYEKALWSAPHEDINYITLIGGTVSDLIGLEVRTKDNQWVSLLDLNYLDLDKDEFILICNVGDMLQEASGYEYISTTHKVSNKTGIERFSMPVFIHAHPEVILSRRKGNDFTAKEYLLERLREIGLI